MYDYIIVGAGMFGSVCAREITDAGYKCLVIDKRNHIGGNCYTEEVDGINVHVYGAHIFHTSSKEIWDYMNRFCTFNHYVNRPKVNYNGKIYSFPINLMTLNQIYGVNTPFEAEEMMKDKRINIAKPANLEEWILSQVGEEIYEIFIKGYTTKQWGRDPKLLPSSIIKRLPIRFTFDDNYFNDIYQGIPIGGYTPIFEKLLKGIDVLLETDFFNVKDEMMNQCKKLIYTGPIDRFFDYKYGKLEYRSLRFENKIVRGDFQGNAVVNYTSADVPFTRIIEHKHFEFNNAEKSIITYEYPSIEGDPYYPVNDSNNNLMYNLYKKELGEKVIFGGRLADYKYYDMHQVVGSALKCIKDLKLKK